MNNEDFLVKVLSIFAKNDEHDSLYWKPDSGTISFYVKCSDFFFWGSADLESLEPEDIPALEEAFRDVAIASGSSQYGPELYCARKRGERPQGAAYPRNKKLWPLFDECGPYREIGVGNPYCPGYKLSGRDK